ncbi:S1 RNA-binding domain-containing protein [Lentzea sp. CA-135723]|uniref:S1 RNA-binding domain-containing protein n=1 Tax=Lentzea sp. CA-135723 TaxID=3239950 RepID=UPI003D925940
MSRRDPRDHARELAEAHPELHAFLCGLRPGQHLSGTVAAIESFGVFVALDDGPPHPFFAGVGFVTVAEVAWEHIDDLADVLEAGQRVTGEFLDHDTWNMEARLSLKALRPDPLRAFAGTATIGQEIRGLVTEVVPFGVFVRVADGIEGLLHEKDYASTPPREGDEVVVVLAAIDPARRTVTLGPA